MKTVVILGAGAMGHKLAALLNKNAVRLVAFGDNNAAVHDSGAGVPVVSVEMALAQKPDMVCLGVAGHERSEALRAQVRDLGYAGPVFALSEMAGDVDFRGAILAHLLPRLEAVGGVVAELGVYQGDFAWQLNAAFPTRPLHLFDTFQGFAAQDLLCEQGVMAQPGKVDFSDTSPEGVQKRMPHPDRVHYHVGVFPDTAAGLEAQFALVSVDVDLYAPTLAGLEYFMPRLSPGGMILLHDYNNPRFAGVKEAVAAYEAAHAPLLLVPLPDLHGTAVIVKA